MIKKLIAIGLLVIGVVLLTIGVQSTHRTSEKVVRELTGKMSKPTFWKIVIGSASAIGGCILLVYGNKKQKP